MTTLGKVSAVEMPSIDTILHPERYQGARRRYPYFEGWYYKLVGADERHRYALIVGIYKGPTRARDEAFVQFMDGVSGAVRYYRYAAEAFQPRRGAFDVLVGASRFTAESISLRLEGPQGLIAGEVVFGDLKPWPVTLISPGIMGPFAWLPFMECYHGVISLDHSIQGALRIDDEMVDLSGGRGYAEKDWGRRFPAAWVWYQSNHFDSFGTSLSASVALIPFLGRTFVGLIVGLLHAGRLYRLTTYTGARIERLAIDEDRVTLRLADRRRRLLVEIHRTTPGQLFAPSIDGMGGPVGETLDAGCFLRLAERDAANERLIVEAHSRLGGLEVVGDFARLQTG